LVRQQQLECLGAGPGAKHLHVVALQQRAHGHQVLGHVVHDQDVGLARGGAGRGGGRTDVHGWKRRNRSRIWPRVRTSSAPAWASAEAGIIEETASSGHWIQATPPASRTAAMPWLPSLEAPVSSSASRRRPKTAAALSNRGSIAGRENITGSSCESASVCRSSTSRW